jgi:glyoxylase-like metal-dependent hydrolase (beta-lactamase superfamily II)
MIAEPHVDPAAFAVTGYEQHAAWQRRDLPPVERLDDGVWSIPVPMADHPMRYVLCYLLEGTSGPVLVDPGWPDDASWTALLDGLSQAGWETSDVHGVLVSHAHSDHLGLAGRLREESGCWIGMHPLDAQMLRTYEDGSAAAHRNSAFLDVAGVPGVERPALRTDPEMLRRLGAARPDRLVEDGDARLVPGRTLKARWTPGHTPGHLCFVDAEVGHLYSGDHLLPRISTNVSSYDAGGEDVLGQYLSSLTDLAGTGPAAAAEVLPAHEYRFRGVAGRVAALLSHHDQRLDEVLEAVRDIGEPTVWEVAGRIRWSRGWTETTGARRRLALAETLAHLQHLASTRRVAMLAGRPVRWRDALRDSPTRPSGRR